MRCKNPSEWRVSTNFFGCAKQYIVYRIRDIDEVNHSGNREYRGKYCGNYDDAKALADKLNEEERNGIN